MKRVLQLTFHCAINYGAVLQTYALGTMMKKLGHSVKVLNLRPFWMSPILPGKRPSSWLVKLKFYWFSKKYLPRMTRCLRDSSRLAEQCKDIDAVVVGSDQVWNPELTLQFADDYFLKFVPSPVRRISYAASFGIEPFDWLQKYDDGHKGLLLKDFYAISLRETTGDAICRSLMPELKTKLVLDPTLLLSEKDYKENLNLQNKRYGIVSFKIIPGSAYYSMLEKMELTMKENVVLLNSRKKCGFAGIPIPSPTAWLETIAGASFVVTDSFHATCFAVIFRKEFVVLPSLPSRICRLKCLLEQLGIGDRLFSCEDDVLSKLPTLGKVNYEQISDKLQKLRMSSLKFLTDSLS